MAATSRLHALLAAWRRLLGLFLGVVASGSARAVELPEDRADLMYHYYDGGGTTASGPALLVRKGLADKVSLWGRCYLDMVSNASIDVVSTASKYKENRHEETLGVDYLYRDALISLSGSTSAEPDYKAKAANLDVSQDVFEGLTTISLGYTRGWDKVGRKGDGFIDAAKHWRYRLGVTQVVTPRILTSLNFEAVSDDGFLGNPYRAARAFGALVPERHPRTRTSRSVMFRAIGDLGSRDALYGSYRYFWDTWAIRAHTFDVGYRRYFGERWFGDAYLRYYKQSAALFYSDNAQQETLYLSRNKQLATFDEYGLGMKVWYRLKAVPGKYDIRLNGVVERARLNFDDFTDVFNGSKYKYDHSVIQLFVSATF